MVPEIKKILFTTNLAPNSRHAFEYAISIANRYGAVVTVLHVIAEVSQSSDAHVKSFLGDQRWQELQESRAQEAKQILIGKRREGVMIKEALEVFCSETQKDHDECEFLTDETVVTSGNVVNEILAVSRDKGCDLIVMGYHVRGKLEEAFLASTTRRVLRLSKIPVLLVRLPEEE